VCTKFPFSAHNPLHTDRSMKKTHSIGKFFRHPCPAQKYLLTFDLDLGWLGLRRLRQLQRKYTVFARRFYLICIYLSHKIQIASETAVGSLNMIEALFSLLPVTGPSSLLLSYIVVMCGTRALWLGVSKVLRVCRGSQRSWLLRRSSRICTADSQSAL